MKIDLPELDTASAQGLRIEVRQSFDMRFQWVLIGPQGSLAKSRYFFSKVTCLKAVRTARRACNGASVDDCTLTAPLLPAEVD